MSDIKSNTSLLPGMQSSIEASKESLGQLNDQMAELPQVMQQVLQGLFERWQYAASTNIDMRNTTPAITHMELIGALGIHVFAHMKVLEDVLQQTSDFDVPSLRQVRGLTQHREFDHWFKAESSSLLFVECHLQDCGPTVTAASVFSSSLICTLSAQRNVIPLFFFARLDGGMSDAGGPVHMLRSLVFQLLMSNGTAFP
ncbi:hypothetical protein MKX07_003912 [Trichoderma sp. CBMAI-0711]|nr:hypothetical protein MKX07_003912 [Trichoderma sp. CBMAI-0711]